MAEYRIALNDGEYRAVSGLVLRLGRGKKAVDVLGIRRGGKNPPFYVIDHIPSGRYLGLYHKQALARSVAEAVLDHLGVELLNPTPKVPGDIRRYVVYYEGATVDEALSYEEWKAGSDAINQGDSEFTSNNLLIPGPQGAQDTDQLLSGYFSLGWVPGGESTGLLPQELIALIQGYPLPGSSIS